MEDARMALKGVFIAGLLLIAMPGLVSAQACYESSVMSPTPFMGNDGEIFKLADGSLWKVKYEYEYMYEYYPDVIICPSRGKLVVGKKTLNVEQIAAGKSFQPRSAPTADIIESRINGEFSGWEGETIVKLMNGQIWQQTEYYYHYHYSYMPDVLIYNSGGGWKMKVEGIDKAVLVERLK